MPRYSNKRKLNNGRYWSNNTGPARKRMRGKRTYSRRSGNPLQSRRRQNVIANLRSAGFLGIENKFVDAIYGPTAIGVTWATSLSDPTLGSLTGAAQGDGPSNRDGKNVRNNGIYLREHINIPQQEAAADPFISPYVRIVLVRDKQTNAAAMAGNNVFSTAAAPDIQGLRSLEYIQRFDVLYDKTFKCNIQTLSSPALNSFNMATFKVPFSINLPNVKDMTTYLASSTTGDIAGITDNSYHLLAIADDISTNPTLTYFVRGRFYG